MNRIPSFLSQSAVCALMALAALPHGASAQTSRILTGLEGFADANGPLVFNQTDNQNILGAVMNGPNADIDVVQTGAYNRIAILQFDADPIATTDQVDRVNTAFIIQADNNANAALIQNGAFNAAGVVQDPAAGIIAFNQNEREELVRSLIFAPETTLIAPTLGMEMTAGLADMLLGSAAPAQCWSYDPAYPNRCRLSARLLGRYDSGDYEPRLGALGFDYDSAQGAVAVEHAASPNLTLGAALGYGQGSADYPAGLGDAEAQAFSGALYARARAGGAYGSVAALYGHMDYETNRPGHLGRTRGDSDGEQRAIAAEAGYEYALSPNFALGPVGGLTYASADMEGFDESGDPFFVQRIGDRRAQRIEGRLGMAIKAQTLAGGVPIKARAALYAARDYDVSSPLLFSSSFAFAPTTTVFTPQQDFDSDAFALLDLGLSVAPAKGVALELSGGGIFGNDRRSNYHIGGGLSLAF